MVAEFSAAAIAWYEKLGYTTRERRLACSLSDQTRDGHVD